MKRDIRLLIVDDKVATRYALRRRLESHGYEVLEAGTGGEGLELIDSVNIDALILDVNLPDMSGFDIVRKLRADPDLQDLPVIMITSRIAQKHRDHAAQLGVEHYLGKPYSEEKLLALITQCMSQQTDAQAV